ncbi:MAG: GldM family protein [Saprospiraceae bacterium]
MSKKMIILTFIFKCFTLSLNGQSNNCYCELRNRDFLIGLDNPIQLVNDKYEFIEIRNINATFEDYDTGLSQSINLVNENGNYKINPTKLGKITLHIQAKNCEVKRTLTVKPITATPRIGIYTSNENKKIKWAELQAYSGMTANIECCDIDGKCNVIGFEIYLIQSNSKVLKSINIGGKYTNETLEIIKKSKSNDILLFRNIKYKCSGANVEQRMPDMTLEIE